MSFVPNTRAAGPRPVSFARIALAPVVAAGGVALAACDPCAGVVSCGEAPRVGVSGQIVDRGDPSDLGGGLLSGATIPQARPVAGVRVEVIPTGGVIDGVAPVTATTDRVGWWQVSIPAHAAGLGGADVVVTAPGSSGYRVRDLTLRASSTRGDGNVLGRWTHLLYMTKLGEVINVPGGERPDGVRVSVRRSGGIPVAPTRNTAETLLTEGGGRFVYDVRPLADGPLVVDVRVERDGLPPATVRGVNILPEHEWVPINVDGALSLRLDPAGNRQ